MSISRLTTSGLSDQQIHRRAEALRPIPAASKLAFPQGLRKNLVSRGYRWNPNRSHWAVPKNALNPATGHNLKPPNMKQKPGYPGGSRPSTT